MNSTDEDESTPSLLVKDHNEEYMEPCGDEIKDIVPRLQRLNVNDEQWDLRSEILNQPSTAETIPSLINIDNEISAADRSVQVSPVVANYMPGNISKNDGTKTARGNEKSPSTSIRITHDTLANIQVGNQSQDLIQNISSDLPIQMHPVNQNDEHELCECEEMKETGVKRSQKASPKNKKQVDPETGESSNTLSIILPGKQGNDRIDNISEKDELGQFDEILGSRINKRECSADVSNDDQSNMNRGKLNISMSDTHNAGTSSTGLVESKRHRKIAVFANPASQNRQRRFSTFNRSSDNFEEETLKANSISQESNSGVVENDSPKKSRRRCQKIKPSSTPGFQISPDLEDKDETRPNPGKRKQFFTDNLDETTGKSRRRYTSEGNTAAHLTIQKTQSVLHSRSLSLGMKETHSSVEFSLNKKSRKRTSSDYQNLERVKSRRSSSSSEEAENK